MLFSYSTVVAVLASTAVAAPLNINLGAYSPAVVVGDGEISFAAGGAAGAAGLVSTLQGQAAASQGAVAQGAAIAPAQRSVLSEPASLPVPGVARSELSPREELEEKRQEGGLAKRQASGFDRALTFAEAALVKGPKIQLGTPAAGVGIIVDNNPTPAAAVSKAE